MKRIKKKATAWLVAAVGFILALIAYGFYKMAVVVYGPPAIKNPTIYGPPPHDYEIKNDSMLSQCLDRHSSFEQDSLRNDRQKKEMRNLDDKSMRMRECVYGPPPGPKHKKKKKTSKKSKHPNEYTL